MTFKSTWVWKAKSDVYALAPNQAPPTPSEIAEKLIYGANAPIVQAMNRFLIEMQKGGNPATIGHWVVNANAVYVGYEIHDVAPRVQEAWNKYQTEIQLRMDFYTEKAVAGSPIAPLIILAIAAAIIILTSAVAAGIYFALKNLTTTESTVTTETIEYNPDGTIKTKTTTTEKTTAPPTAAITTPWIIIGVVAIVIVIGFFGISQFRGGKK